MKESTLCKDFFCPMPIKWNEVYSSLLQIWIREGQDPHDKPPIPLILAAWHEATGTMKAIRWQETIEWAKRHKCSHLIPELKEEEKFRG
jgi:hypothetical protein